MKSSKFAWLVLVIALACSACPGVNDEGEPGPGRETEGNAVILKDLVADGTSPLFYSLSTGEQVADPRSTAWDIVFIGGRQIRTNSGASAGLYQSGGQGGVWYTDKKVFAEVTSTNDAVTEPQEPRLQVLKGLTEDVLRYGLGMSGGAELGLLARITNVMTYAGYSNEFEEGAGLSEDKPYDAPYLYNKRQFYYNAGAMPPLFKPTNQVYVIRHGDGVHYSKFQITAYTNLPDTFTVIFENLPE
jgi:hypothetical protein